MASLVTLQFIREARITSDAIAWFSAGNLSHVDAVLPEGLLGAYERSAGTISPGVYVRPDNYAVFAAQVRFDIPVSETQYNLWSSFLHSQVGLGYDWKNIAGFVADQDWHGKGAWMCSALQTAALQFASIIPKLYLPDNKITPVTLATVVSVLPGIAMTVLK